MMLYQLTTDGTMEFPHIDAVAPWFDFVVRNPQQIEKLHSPRIFKSHRSFRQLPTSARYIYVVRNPKDSCVSYYHHLTSFNNYTAPFAHFVREFINGNIIAGSWFEHLASCAKYRPSRTLTIVYDQLVERLPEVVDKVIAFCELTIDDSVRRRTIERCQFQFMKQYEALFDPRFVGGRRVNITPAPFIRNGKVGDWVREFTPSLSQAIDQTTAKCMEYVKSNGSHFDIECLRFGHSRVRGTIRAAIGFQGHNHLLVETRTDPHPFGALLLLPTEIANVRDCVRLELGVDQARIITVEGAELMSVNNVGIKSEFTFRFLNMDLTQDALIGWQENMDPALVVVMDTSAR
jgi:hypothetical protein